MLVEPI